MDQPMEQGKTCAKCGCFHHQVIPLCVLLIGLSFLLTNLGLLSAGFNGFAWPLLLIIIGLMKMFGKNCKCCCKKC